MVPENDFTELKDTLVALEDIIKTDPIAPNIKASLDILKFALPMHEGTLPQKQYKELYEQYKGLQAQYDQIAKNARFPGCPWLDNSNYI